MEIEEERQSSLIVVSPAGRVDGVSAPELAERLAGIAARGDFRVLLDCGRMTYISSAGLRTVLIGARECQRNGGKLTLCGLQPACRRVMELGGFLDMIDSHATRGEALAARSGAGGS